MVANAVNVSRGNRRKSRNRLIPWFGKVANPQKVEKISEKNMKNVTKISWQPWRTKELATELADSSANVSFLN
jgi:hypothetical protein